VNSAPGLGPDGPALEVKRIVGTLDRRGVSYLLIGGLGATLYGAERVTQDIDVLLRTDAENLARLAVALRDLGAFLRVGGLSDEEARALPNGHAGHDRLVGAVDQIGELPSLAPLSADRGEDVNVAGIGAPGRHLGCGERMTVDDDRHRAHAAIEAGEHDEHHAPLGFDIDASLRARADNPDERAVGRGD